MSASNHKVGSPIRVWQNLGNTFINQATNLKQWWDQVGEIVREKHDALCDYIDNNIATKTELQNVILGQIADGSVTTAKLAPDALQANVTKLSVSTSSAYGTDNVDSALAFMPKARYYGKYSQMSGGGSKPVSSSDSLLTFSTEDKDDFSAINIPTSNSRITIPAGISVCKFYFKGRIAINGFPASGGASIKLFKNGVLYQTLNEVATTFWGVSFSTPIPVSTGDYFDIRVSTGSSSTELVAGSIFGMEVLS